MTSTQTTEELEQEVVRLQHLLKEMESMRNQWRDQVLRPMSFEDLLERLRLAYMRNHSPEGC
jgi:hypothetical protein